MDIWDGAHEVVLKRLMADGFDTDHPDAFGRIESNRRVVYATEPPQRTDGGEPATLTLRTPTGRPQRYPAPRTQHVNLLADIGPFCQGCGRDYGFDPRVLEVDHVLPKSDGGTDAYENLTLLCPPCNKEKRDRLTLSGLQDVNRRAGHMLPTNEGNIRRGRTQRTVRRRRG